MIKTLQLNNIRWIDQTFNLDKLAVFTWWNAVGKSTILQVIKEIYKGKNTIKKWTATIIDDDWVMLQMVNWLLPNKDLKLWSDMDLMIPWFFLKWKKIKWLNSTKEDQRKTISDILWIDRDKFFLDKNIDYDLSWLTWDLRDIKVRETTYTEQLLKAETELSLIKDISKPKKVTLVRGNENELQNLKDQISKLWDRLQDVKILIKCPDEIELIQDKVTQGNEKDLEDLRIKLSKIIAEWKAKSLEIENLKLWTIKEYCPTCNQKLSNIDAALTIEQDKYDAKIIELRNKKDELIKEYNLCNKEIKEFELIKTETIKWNFDEYERIKEEINIAKQRDIEISKAIENNLIVEKEKRIIEDKISKFKLTKWNQDKYEEYNIKLNDYNKNILEKENLEKQIDDYIKDIESLNWKEIEDKILKYKIIEKEFINSIEWITKIWDLEFTFYKELKSPNAKGEMFQSDFNIKYKGKMYDECSWWEQSIIDIILAKIFIKHSWLLDFILIDDTEISRDNLRNVIKEHLQDLQVITTRIWEGELTLSDKL